jgi:hypothetical protein
MPNVYIGPANPTVGDFEFDLIIPTNGLLDINNPDVALSGRILNDSFH